MTTTQIFDEICELIDWDKNNFTIDFNQTKARLMQIYTKAEILSVKDLSYQLRENIESVIDKNNLRSDIGQSDSVSDLIYHIISLGTQGIKKYLDQPDLILKKFKNKEYVESFVACIPMELDYEMTTKEHYQKFALDIGNILNELSIFTKIFKRKKIALAKRVLFEFEQGIFKPEYNYNQLRDLFEEIKIGVWMANMWDDGHIFYGLKIKQ